MEMARRRKDINEVSFPVSASMNSSEFEMLVATAELCGCARSAVIRRGVRLAMLEAVREAEASENQGRLPDFSNVLERERRGCMSSREK